MIHSQQIQVLNKIAIYTLLFVLGAVLFAKCGNNIEPIIKDYKPIYDSLQKEVDKNKELASVAIQEAETHKHNADSIKSIKQKVLTKWVNKKSTDTIYVELVNYCDSMNSINDKIIDSQDFALSHYVEANRQKDSTIQIQENQIALNILEIEQQKELVNLEKKKLKKQKVKSFFNGIVVGALATIAAGTSLLLLK